MQIYCILKKYAYADHAFLRNAKIAPQVYLETNLGKFSISLSNGGVKDGNATSKSTTLRDG